MQLLYNSSFHWLMFTVKATTDMPCIRLLAQLAAVLNYWHPTCQVKQYTKMQLAMHLKNAVFVNLNIFLLYMSNFYECKKIYSNYIEEFINLAVVSDYVYIGGKNSLKCHSSLWIHFFPKIVSQNWHNSQTNAKNPI